VLRYYANTFWKGLNKPTNKSSGIVDCKWRVDPGWKEYGTILTMLEVQRGTPMVHYSYTSFVILEI
jgi:hypothetical protein